jgi:ribosomal protein L11 methyltransferase
MIELFPEGFEEGERGGGLELAAYTNSEGAAKLWRAFGEYAWSEVPEAWQTRWREFHRPVRIGPLWVGPPWLEPEPDAVAVVIDPGRAFGTGAHPTTQVCLELICELSGTRGGNLLDVGCGSGVLAIAAAKLGFSPVVALDHDEVTLTTARENARANDVSLDLRLLEALEDELPPADLIVANVSATIVEALAARVSAGRFLSSGYLASESPHLPGFSLLERRIRDGWAADLWKPI